MAAESSVTFGEKGPPTLEGGRFNAPSFHRNRQPFEEVLRRHLPQAGNVLEIGSGTGQHASAYGLSFPALVWWPSDPNPLYRSSIDAWAAYAGASNVRPAADIEAAAEDWGLGADGLPPAQGLVAVTCMNVIHISPWEAAVGVVSAAGRYLGAGGHLFFYGPFKRGGAHTHYRNAAFDGHLRAGDPRWGVRDMDDVSALARENGLELAEAAEMPSHNFTLVYVKA